MRAPKDGSDDWWINGERLAVGPDGLIDVPAGRSVDAAKSMGFRPASWGF